MWESRHDLPQFFTADGFEINIELIAIGDAGGIVCGFQAGPHRPVRAMPVAVNCTASLPIVARCWKLVQAIGGGLGLS